MTSHPVTTDRLCDCHTGTGLCTSSGLSPPSWNCMTSYSVSTDLCGSHRYSLMSSLLVRMPGSWSKGCEFEFRHEWWENVLLQSQFCVLTLIWCLFHPHVTPVAHKGPGHSAKSAGGRLNLDTHTSLTQQSWSGMTMLLSLS